LACGQREPEIKLTIDHVVPLVRNGSHDKSNIQPLCLSCNDSKGTKVLDYRGQNV
jgi:5-methylcytosine-specific restriction endonuclease McrA